MHMEMPDNVRYIIKTLYKNGFEAFAVGGCVRDTLLGRKPQDWDITTSALPEQVKALFRRTIDTGIQHGTVTIMLDHIGYEVTTYRIDGEYEDARHPKEVTFTSNLIEDLKRRDFTINAMAYNDQQGLVDAFDGIGDLEKGIIRCVGNPHDRFGEDALRMFRAVRFAAQLGFAIDPATAAAVRDLAPTIAKVSAERIQVELVKLLTSAHPEEMRTLYELGITKVILPEWDLMMETEQENPHHCYTVGEHTICGMQGVSRDKVLRLTMLLHDVAKPVVKMKDEFGIAHYNCHPQKGADMAKQILMRLKFDNDTIGKVYRLIQWHDDNPVLTPTCIRRAMNRVGLEQYPALFEIKHADILAQSSYQREEKLAALDEYRRLWQQILDEKQCVSKKDLAISGRDLIAAGMKPGKEMGMVLDMLFDQVLENPEINDKETLLALAKARFSLT